MIWVSAGGEKRLLCSNRFGFFITNMSVHHPANHAALCTDCLVWIWRQTPCTRTWCVHTTVVFDYNYRCKQEKKVFWFFPPPGTVLSCCDWLKKGNEFGLQLNESQKFTANTHNLSTPQNPSAQLSIIIFAVFLHTTRKSFACNTVAHKLYMYTHLIYCSIHMLAYSLHAKLHKIHIMKKNVRRQERSGSCKLVK